MPLFELLATYVVCMHTMFVPWDARITDQPLPELCIVTIASDDHLRIDRLREHHQLPAGLKVNDLATDYSESPDAEVTFFEVEPQIHRHSTVLPVSDVVAFRLDGERLADEELLRELLAPQAVLITSQYLPVYARLTEVYSPDTIVLQVPWGMTVPLRLAPAEQQIPVLSW